MIESIGFLQIYCRNANFERENILPRSLSPSSVSEYSTRGGTSEKVRRRISPAPSSSVSRIESVEELISSTASLKSLKRMDFLPNRSQYSNGVLSSNDLNKRRRGTQAVTACIGCNFNTPTSILFHGTQNRQIHIPFEQVF